MDEALAAVDEAPAAVDGKPAGGAELLLARHGQTDDNLEPLRAQGFRDTPLNEVGLEQAHLLAEHVAEDYDVRSLWTSDLARAAVTAGIVGARIGLEPRPDPRLREGYRGDWEGRLFVDIAREDPEAYAAWMRAGARLPFPRWRVAAGARRPSLGGARADPRRKRRCRRWSSATAARSAPSCAAPIRAGSTPSMSTRCPTPLWCRYEASAGVSRSRFWPPPRSARSS